LSGARGASSCAVDRTTPATEGYLSCDGSTKFPQMDVDADCRPTSAHWRYPRETEMHPKLPNPGPSSAPTTIPVLLSPKEAAQKLHCSVSFLAKKRMTGDGPPFVKRGRAVLYTEPALVQWIKSQTRMSTSVVCALFALLKAAAPMAFMSIAT